MSSFGSQFSVVEVSIWMDGGSVDLICQNENGQEFKIEFVQNVLLQGYKPDRIPGRIYLNEELVQMRSELEVNIIQTLILSEKSKLDDLEKRVIEEKIDYIQSDKYIEDQKLINNVE